MVSVNPHLLLGPGEEKDVEIIKDQNALYQPSTNIHQLFFSDLTPVRPCHPGGLGPSPRGEGGQAVDMKHLLY